jgi:hypothetical protein
MFEIDARADAKSYRLDPDYIEMFPERCEPERQPTDDNPPKKDDK